MESSRLLTYFQNYEKYSKFANIQDVFGAEDTSSSAHSFNFKFDTSARSVIKNAIQIQMSHSPQNPSETLSPERINSPEVVYRTEHIGQLAGISGSSHSNLTDGENTENTGELVWRSAGPVATPKYRNSIITSTKIGDQVFADSTNHRLSVSAVEEVSDTPLRVGADRQRGQISEHILTMTQQLTHSPVSGVVDSSFKDNPPISSALTGRQAETMSSRSGRSSRVTRSSAAVSRSEESTASHSEDSAAVESEPSVEDVQISHSSATPTAHKLRLVDYNSSEAGTDCTIDDTDNSRTEKQGKLVPAYDLTQTITYDKTSEQSTRRFTSNYDGDADSSFRTPLAGESTRRPRISDTTYTPATPNSTVRPDGHTLQSSVENSEGYQNAMVTLSYHSLIDRIHNEIADVTKTLDRVSSAPSSQAPDDGTFTLSVQSHGKDRDKTLSTSNKSLKAPKSGMKNGMGMGDTYEKMPQNDDDCSVDPETNNTYDVSDHNQNNIDTPKTSMVGEKSTTSKKMRLSLVPLKKSVVKTPKTGNKSRKSTAKANNDTESPQREHANNESLSRLSCGTPVMHVRTVQQRASQTSSRKSEAIANLSKFESSVEVSDDDPGATFTASDDLDGGDYGDDYDMDHGDADDFDDTEGLGNSDTMDENTNNNSKRSSRSRTSSGSGKRLPSRKSSAKKKAPSKASISLRRKSSVTTSKVIVKKKNSRFSVYDPEMPSVSGSPQHYGEMTKSQTPKPTRAKNRGIRGEKFNTYNSPHPLKPHMTPRSKKLGLRRSHRTKLRPLRHYAGERPVYEYDPITTTYNIAGVNKSHPEDDFILRHNEELSSKKKKSKRSGKSKKKKADKTLCNVDSDASFSDGEVEIHDGDEMVTQVVTNNRSEVVYYDLSGAVAEDTAEVKVSKLLQNAVTSCGDLVIAGLCEKMESRLAGYTVTFTVSQGAVMLVINDKIKKVLKAGACCSVPDGNAYMIKNLWRDEAKLFFVACRVGG